jgi:hypothetical protein
LVSFLLHHPGSWNETKQHARRIMEAAARDLDQEVVETAIERGKGLDLNSLVVQITKLEDSS